MRSSWCTERAQILGACHIVGRWHLLNPIRHVACVYTIQGDHGQTQQQAGCSSQASGMPHPPCYDLPGPSASLASAAAGAAAAAAPAAAAAASSAAPALGLASADVGPEVGAEAAAAANGVGAALVGGLAAGGDVAAAPAPCVCEGLAAWNRRTFLTWPARVMHVWRVSESMPACSSNPDTAAGSSDKPAQLVSGPLQSICSLAAAS